MNKAPLSVFLVITSAIVIDGAIAKAGSLVEVSDTEARNLLHRGKARVATDEDAAKAGIDLPADAAEGPQVDLFKLTKAELLKAAQEGGLITLSDSNTKAEIIAAIQAAAADQADE